MVIWHNSRLPEPTQLEVHQLHVPVPANLEATHPGQRERQRKRSTQEACNLRLPSSDSEKDASKGGARDVQLPNCHIARVVLASRATGRERREVGSIEGRSSWWNQVAPGNP
jgi:hypothetical protein